MKLKEIKFSDIKPENCGNFEFIVKGFFEKIEKIEETGVRNKDDVSKIAKYIKFIVGECAMLDELEEGIKKKKAWNIDEATNSLLAIHLILIKLNMLAHSFVNPTIKMPTVFEQLVDSINDRERDKEVYGNIKIVE